jgi:hypothetical protein
MSSEEAPITQPAFVERRECAKHIANLEAQLCGHVLEAHQHDELIRRALWGARRPTIDNPEARDHEHGVVFQVDELHKAQRNGGIRAKLRGRDAALIAAIVAVSEVVTTVLRSAT